LESSKGVSVILIVVIAVLALALAGLAGYLFLVQGQQLAGGESGGVVFAEGYTYIPGIEELSELDVYDGKKYFNLKTDESGKTSILQVVVNLKYITELKEDKKLAVPERVEAYRAEIQELIGAYFLGVTLEDVKSPDGLQVIKEDLKDRINDLLNSGDKQKHVFVYNVIFSDWVFQAQ